MQSCCWIILSIGTVLSPFKRLEAEFFHHAVRSSVSESGINLHSETTSSVLRPSIWVRKSLPFLCVMCLPLSVDKKKGQTLVKTVKVWTDEATAALQERTHTCTHNIPLLSSGPCPLFPTLQGNEANKSQYSCSLLDFSPPSRHLADCQPVPIQFPAAGSPPSSWGFA